MTESAVQHNLPKKIVDKYELIIKFIDYDFKIADDLFLESKISDIMTLKDFKTMIRQMSSLVMVAKKEKTFADNAQIAINTSYIQIISMIFVFSYFVLMLIGFFANLYIIIIIANICMVTGLSLAMMLTCHNFIREMKPIQTLKEHISDNFNRFLNTKNLEYAHLLEFEYVDKFENIFLGIKVLNKNS